MFPSSSRAGRQNNIDDNRRAIDEAATLDADCLVLVVGGLPEGSKDISKARDQVFEGISTVLEHARSNTIPLAIEPLHPMYAPDRACVNTMKQALDICDKLGDGIIELQKIRGWVEDAGYDSCCEVEIFSSENWWKEDPDVVLETCIERHQTVV